MMVGLNLFCRPSVDCETRWYKFDDGEVSECVMDDDEVSLVVVLNLYMALKIGCSKIMHTAREETFASWKNAKFVEI